MVVYIEKEPPVLPGGSFSNVTAYSQFRQTAESDSW